MKNFRTYALAVEFYRSTRSLKLPGVFVDQLQRAASSVVLNLAEGRGRRTAPDQRRHFQIAMGSVRECQAIFDLAELQGTKASVELDSLGAHLYKLIKSAAG
jgi:four helix bundle protein